MDGNARTEKRLWDLDRDVLQSVFEFLGPKDLARLASVDFVPVLITDSLTRRDTRGTHAVPLPPAASSLPRSDAARLAKLEYRRNEAAMPMAVYGTNSYIFVQHGQLVVRMRDRANNLRMTTPVDGTKGFMNVCYTMGRFAAVSSSGQVYTWTFENTPSIVSALQNTRIRSVALGAYHTLAVAENGHVYSWGSGRQGQLGYDAYSSSSWSSSSSSSSSVSSSSSSSSSSMSSSSVIDLWRQRQPRRIIGIRGAARCASAGDVNSLVVTEEGTVYTFGLQHGVQRSRVAFLPEKIDLTDLLVTSTASGRYHSLAVTQGGMVLSWGFDVGQLGRPRKGRKPHVIGFHTQDISLIPSIGGIRSVAASRDVSCAVTTDGKLYVWGVYDRESRPFSRAPMVVDALRNEVVVAVSINSNCIIVKTLDGRILGVELPNNYVTVLT